MIAMRACFICESNARVEKYHEVSGHDYMRCSQCGLIFVDRVESPEKLYKSYDGGSAKSLRRKLVAHLRGFTMVKNFQRSMDRATHIFKFIASNISNHRHQPALLDIGCNKGFLLAAAIAHDWNVYGVEIVPELLIPFRKRFKQFADQVFSGRFIDAQEHLNDNAFDAITAIDVIEHFESPEHDIAIIFRKLKTGGIFIAQTPDGGCEQARAEQARWGALKPLEHLHIFNRANLEKFAKKLGFREIAFFDPFEHADGNLVAVMKK